MIHHAVTGTPVIMPELLEGMEEGTVLRWLVGDGDDVTAGQPIVEVETDKATTELAATADGRLWHLAPEGAAVTVRSELAMIGPERQSGSAPSDASPPDRPPTHSDRVPVARDGRRQVASPLARRMASELGVDLATLRGTGTGGRIRRADVLAAAGGSEPAPGDADDRRVIDGGAQRAAGNGSAEREPPEQITPTRVQLRIAERMMQAKSTIPDFAISMTVDMQAASEMRNALRAPAESSGTRAPSVNDMVVKACALALREHPEVNASSIDDKFHLHKRINVGVAVATDGSLVVPTIPDADQRSLGSIAQESRRLASAVRDGTVTPAELAGGTFTISNLGMFGVSAFTAVVNPPQAAILAVGRSRKPPLCATGR